MSSSTRSSLTRPNQADVLSTVWSGLNSSRTQQRRRGFTIVELLVVIVIIGILVAIIIPAVGAVRRTAQKTQCANNLRQVGIAITAFETNKQRYPASIYNPVGTNSITTFTWVVPLLPALDQDVLYDNLQNEVQNGNDAMAVWLTGSVVPDRAKGAYLNMLNCPSDPNKTFIGPQTSYVVNMGTLDGTGGNFAGPIQPNTLDFRALGIFHNRSNWARVNNLDVSMDRDGIKDGESYTLLVSENGNATYWGPMAQDDPSTNQDERDFYLSNYETSHGMVFWNAQNSPLVTGNACGPNYSPWRVKPSDVDCFNQLSPRDQSLFARPSSYHSQGFNAVFGGNEVRYISNSIDYTVYARMMTPDGISLNGNNWPFAKGGLRDDEIE